MDFVNGVYLWSYGAVTEDGVETDLQSGKYLSFTLVNGQNRNIRLFIICNSETKTSLQHLGAGSEVLVYGKVHVVGMFLTGSVTEVSNAFNFQKIAKPGFLLMIRRTCKSRTFVFSKTPRSAKKLLILKNLLSNIY